MEEVFSLGAPLKSENGVTDQTPTTIEEIPEEQTQHDEEETEEETVEIEAMANSDGVSSAKEGIITSDLRKEEQQDLDDYSFEKQQLTQKIQEISAEKSEEIERWIQKYQLLQAQCSDLQAQINLSSTVSIEANMLENNYQKALTDIGVLQTQYRLLEQEKLSWLEEKDRITSDWQAKYEELQQRNQMVEKEIRTVAAPTERNGSNCQHTTNHPCRLSAPARLGTTLQKCGGAIYQCQRKDKRLRNCANGKCRKLYCANRRIEPRYHRKKCGD
ncbi:MAG: hypothetical protein HC912_09400 [Saprospiraceae bacterium]|nr:hypothetical protein [Saprospiraceae bacterium]